MTETLPESLTLPVLPLDDDVVLPTMVVPLDASDPEVRAPVAAATTAAEGDAGPRVLLVPRIGGKYAPVGTLGVVEQEGRLPNGKPGVVVRGLARVRIGAGTVGPGAALWVHGTVAAEPPAGPRTAELAREYRGLAAAILQKRGAWQVVDVLSRITDPSALADSAGYASYLSVEQRSELLETLDAERRLELLVGWARDHIAELEVAETIGNDVREGMEKQQREFLLRQQLAAIRKELAALDGTPATEQDDYRARIEAADLPEKVREAALREAAKLERGSDASPEAGWIRTWLDTVLDVPWNVRTDDAYDIGGARAVLDADHAGLDEVKERIIEYLAVRKRLADRGMAVAGGRRSGAVLALAGPPGVGKTSLGESVARAMGRKFARVALGGVRDEAEIRGHRRTYVGALPGRVVRAIRESGSMNPVILLDEVDKVGADYRGDPTAALLEVLDPAQNHTFRDHYLEVELDLSDVLFIATANVAEMIPEPLLDRMDLIRLDGYTEDEKVTIATDHLLPRQLERAGMAHGDVTFTDDALRKLATEYTREAGVRSLERSLARVLRKIAAELAAQPADGVPAAQGVAQPAGVAGTLPAARARSSPDRRCAGSSQVPRPSQAHARISRAHRSPRRRGRPSRHRHRRRPAVHRGVPGGRIERQHRRDADRPARRRDEGVRPDRPVLPALERPVAWPAGQRAGRARRAPARPGGRGAEGRAERGHHDDHGAGFAALRPPGQGGRRDDRRGLADRPGAADRRAEAEAARRAPGRHHDRADPGAQHPRPGRRPREGARGPAHPPRHRRPRRPRTSPGTRCGEGGSRRPRRMSPGSMITVGFCRME